MPFCPGCRREYDEGITRCSDCTLELLAGRRFDHEEKTRNLEGRQLPDSKPKVNKGSPFLESVCMAIGVAIALVLLKVIRGSGATARGGAAILAGLSAFIGAAVGRTLYRSFLDPE